MFAKAYLPEHLSPEALDHFLERGWFRMGQTIFTTNFIHFKDSYYSTLWLRIVLNDLKDETTEAKLFKRNAAFRTEVGPIQLTPEKEALYARYKQPLPFQPSETLHTLLFGKGNLSSVYHTYEVAVYDNTQLIAFGFFDIGGNSAAGIVSVYDPTYKKFSLGKYLIYQKIKYSKEAGLRYFYPGYFVPGYTLFDYKLSIGKAGLQFFKLSAQQWLPVKSFSDQDIPVRVIENELVSLQKLFTKENMESKVLKYEFFDANLVPELREAELFDYPIILTFTNQLPDEITLIVFDVSDSQYHILKCFSVWAPEAPNQSPDVYGDHLLKLQQDLFSSNDAEIVARVAQNTLVSY